MNTVGTVVTWIFMAANTGRILAYIPQIHAAATCQNGARAVSRMTWTYFGVAHMAGAAYGLVVVHDLKMVFIFSMNFVACALVVGLVTWKKHLHAKEHPSQEAYGHKPTGLGEIDRSAGSEIPRHLVVGPRADGRTTAETRV